MKINFIWQKRYFDNTCLLSTRAINKGKNYIAFSADPKLTHYYSIDYNDIITCDKQKNGKGSVYIIPFDKLHDEGILPEQFLNQKYASQQEYIAWKNNLKK